MTFKNKKEMFLWIWENRPHVSELSGEPLLPQGHFKFHWQFLHVLGGQYPSMKLRADNILLGLPEEHERQETFPIFIEKQDELRREYQKEHYGKEF